MKYPILIPSRGRHEEVITLDRMPSELHHHVRLFVPYEEFEDYAPTEYAKRAKLVSVSNYAQRISEKRRLMVEWMMEYENSPWFWMMDDDLTFFERYGEDTRLWQMDTAEEFYEMFDFVEEMVDEEPNRFCSIGISLRQGNNQLEFPYVDNVRLIRCGLYNTDLFLGCEHNRLDFMGDFDVMLQMLRKGYDNRVISAYAQDHRATNAQGGCEVNRDEEAMIRVADGLEKLHHPYVKTKWKTNKTGQLAERKDVTIYWKKARKSAEQ